jgi:hypothetical protein
MRLRAGASGVTGVGAAEYGESGQDKQHGERCDEDSGAVPADPKVTVQFDPRLKTGVSIALRDLASW